MPHIVSTNITWHEGQVSREERTALLKQKGATLWFTGLSGSGKSTIAYTLEHALFRQGRAAYVLDGDNVRFGLNAGPKILIDKRQYSEASAKRSVSASRPRTARRTSAASARSPNCSPTRASSR